MRNFINILAITFFSVNVIADTLPDNLDPARAIHWDLSKDGAHEILDKASAKAKGTKAVWLLRKSGTVPGAIVVSYYDAAWESTANPTGYVHSTHVKNNNVPRFFWESLDPVLAKNFIELATKYKYRFFTPIVATSTYQEAQLKELYDHLVEIGLNIDGQILPAL